MPQLVKGGKHVYGLSKVGENGSIVIPPEAAEEYGFRDGDRVILMSGSRTSGGFGLTKPDIVGKSQLSLLAESLPDLFAFRIPEAKPVSHKGRLFCWTKIMPGSRIVVPPDTLSGYGIGAGDLLAAGRGSFLSIAFIVRGRIMEEARKHPELPVFE